MSMDFSLLGMKELYQVALKATFNMKIGNREVKAGEPITTFEKIQLGEIQEIKQRVSATGGYGNQAWVTWSSTKEVRFNFTQGVFSAVDLALLGNSYVEEDLEPTFVPMVEDLHVNELLEIETKYPAIKEGTYIYEDLSGKRIESFTVDDKVIKLEGVKPFENVKALYNFEYHGAKNIIIGRSLLKGFLELSGKTRLKNDETGQEVTGIIKIPRLTLESDLSITLGKNVPPVVASFETIGYPVGSKGNERVMELILLNDDIDSDF